MSERDKPESASGSSFTTEPWRRYVISLLDRLGLELHEDGSHLSVDRVAQSTSSEEEADEPAPARRWTGGLKTRRRLTPAAKRAAPDFEGDSPLELLDWVAARVMGEDELPCYTPADEPHAVHEFANPMFAAYKVDGGTVHLGGCHLEDVPLVRISRVEPQPRNTGESSGDPEITHRFFDAAGQPVNQSLVGELRLAHLVPPTEPKPTYRRAKWAETIDKAARSLRPRPDKAPTAAIVLAKRAAGRLQVTLGEESLDIPFAGWTRTLTAPPAVCPETGIETYHLMALDDGRIVAAESVGSCGVTGAARLQRDLVSCAVTNQTVASELTEPCPVLGKAVLSDEFATCRTCGERVARTTVLNDSCLGCKSLPRAPRNDDRVAALLEAHPELQGFGGWRVTETTTATFFQGRRWLQKVFVVIDNVTGKVKRAKTRGALQPWREAPVEGGQVRF